MKISQILKSPSIVILLYLFKKKEARYSELAKLIKSRGTLSLNLKDLDEEGLIRRRIVDSKPIQAYYSLSKKGKETAKRFSEIKKLQLSESSTQ